MKVLITTDWYKPAINGVVTSVCNLREELQQRGHEVKILTLSRTARSYEEEGVIYMGSVNAGYIYPGARLRVSPYKCRNTTAFLCLGNRMDRKSRLTR